MRADSLPAVVRPSQWGPDTFGDLEVRRQGTVEGLCDKLTELDDSFVAHVVEHGLLTPVALVIQADGTVRLRDGHHRWALAWALDLPVPVRWFRHDEALRSTWWQEVTDFGLPQFYGKDRDE